MNHYDRNLPLITKAVLCCSSTICQIGWIFFGAGLVFVWQISMSPFQDYASFYGVLNSTNAEVVSANANKKNGAITGYRYSYHYSISPNGTTYVGSGFSNGYKNEVGSSIQIEYPLKNPSLSKIKGTSNNVVKLIPELMPIIFSSVGLCLLLPGLFRGRRSVMALSSGNIADAELVAKKGTSVIVNGRPVYEYIFEYSDLYGNTQCTSIKTHISKKIETEESFSVCFVQDAHKYSVILESLPDGMINETQDDFVIKAINKSLVFLIAPAIVIVANGYQFFIRVML